QTYEIINGQAKLVTSTSITDTINLDTSTSHSEITTTYTNNQMTGVLTNAAGTGQLNGTDSMSNSYIGTIIQNYIIISGKEKLAYSEDTRVLTASDQAWTKGITTKWWAGNGSETDESVIASYDYDQGAKNIRYHQEIAETGTGALSGLNRTIVKDWWAGTKEAQAESFTSSGGWVKSYHEESRTIDTDASANVISDVSVHASRSDITYYYEVDEILDTRHQAGRAESYIDTIWSSDNPDKSVILKAGYDPAGTRTGIEYDTRGLVITSPVQEESGTIAKTAVDEVEEALTQIAVQEDLVSLGEGLAMEESEIAVTVEDLTPSFIDDIVTWLKSAAANAINCAVGALYAMLSIAGAVFSKAELLARSVLVDILAGVIGPLTAGELELSMFSLARTAGSLGAYLKDSVGLYAGRLLSLPAALTGPMITLIDAVTENLVTTGHYVVVTGITADTVTYLDNGDMATLERTEFISRWGDGYTISTEPVDIGLSADELQAVRGSESAEMWEKIDPFDFTVTNTTKEVVTYENGLAVEWIERAVSDSAADKETVSHVRVTYDNLSQIATYYADITEESISDSGASLYKTYSFYKDGISYDAAGRATGWKQITFNSSDAPDVAVTMDITAAYDDKNRMLTYTENTGRKSVRVSVSSFAGRIPVFLEEEFTDLSGDLLLDEHTALEKTEIHYNSLGWADRWLERTVHQAAPAAVTTTVVTTNYNIDGRETSTTRVVTETGATLGHTYTVETTVDSYDDLLGYVLRQTVVTKDNLKTTTEKSVADAGYDARGRLIHSGTEIKEQALNADGSLRRWDSNNDGVVTDADDYVLNHVYTVETGSDYRDNRFGRVEEITRTVEDKAKVTRTITNTIVYDIHNRQASSKVHTELKNAAGVFQYVQYQDISTIYNEEGQAGTQAITQYERALDETGQIAVGEFTETSRVVQINGLYDENGNCVSQRNEYYSPAGGSLLKFNETRNTYNGLIQIDEQDVYNFGCDGGAVDIQSIVYEYDAEGRAGTTVIENYTAVAGANTEHPDVSVVEDKFINKKTIHSTYDNLGRLTRQTTYIEIELKD
ncbi:MAG: hypothetical protein KKG95_08010, partial [Candidatus Omnitrophica bacterium]|nr:hypothetical protein [Candidatus Omnitrophota bacterium]